MKRHHSPVQLACAGLLALGLGGAAHAQNPCATRNPCAPKTKKASNPCAAKKNPCAAKKNPCAAKKNPCSAKNPCAAKSNPCAAK